MTVVVDRRCYFDGLVTLAIIIFTTSSGLIDGWLPGADRGAVSADDPALVKWVLTRLVPPSTLPYNLTSPDDSWGQLEQVRVVQALTRNKTGGFFIESGALDGERFSNTLLLERRFGWSGLLIEPSSVQFSLLTNKRRRAWALEACLSHIGAPFRTVLHSDADGASATVEDGLAADRLRQQQRQPSVAHLENPANCLDIATVLRALGRRSVDFFSLDIEGPEMGVLAHIPWEELDIKILLVEKFLLNSFNPQLDQMRDFMESRGYIAMHLMIDWIFVKRDSEYAQDAVRIVRQAREEIHRRKTAIYFPFND